MKTLRQLCICMLLLILCITKSIAQNSISALIPIPNNIELRDNKKPFDLNKVGKIECNTSNDTFIRQELSHIISKRCGITIEECKKPYTISLTEDANTFDNEEYTIDIKPKYITIKGGKAGVYYALQTLDQIMLGDATNSKNGKIAQIRIEDKPRYSHRAVMLDPARHFLPVEDVKLFIDQIAKFKYNVLQLHLTDDQGWRIEIKSHPELIKIGAFRNPNGSNNGPDNGFYTQEELKEIVRYAQERHIEIIPELDIPGHSVAILSAYPRLGCPFRHNEKKDLGSTTNMMLCANNNDVYKIYEDIIKEVADIFPSKQIHLGGDEAAIKDNWAKCDSCLALMHKAGYQKPSELMNIFFEKILSAIRKNGKEAILWCELDNIYPPANDYLFPYPSDVTLVTWRNGLTPKCIELTREHGHKLIMAPGEYTYLDYPQWKNDLPEFNNWGMPITSLENCYKLDPSYGLPHDKQEHILGVMATMWAEAIKDINRVNYMFFPRGIAIAEAGWSEMKNREWDSFKERLYPNLTDLMKCGISFRVPFEIAK